MLQVEQAKQLTHQALFSAETTGGEARQLVTGGMGLGLKCTALRQSWGYFHSIWKSSQEVFLQKNHVAKNLSAINVYWVHLTYLVRLFFHIQTKHLIYISRDCRLCLREGYYCLSTLLQFLSPSWEAYMHARSSHRSSRPLTRAQCSLPYVTQTGFPAQHLPISTLSPPLPYCPWPDKEIQTR